MVFAFFFCFRLLFPGGFCIGTSELGISEEVFALFGSLLGTLIVIGFCCFRC